MVSSHFKKIETESEYSYYRLKRILTLQRIINVFFVTSMSIPWLMFLF